ncbi:MAG: cation:proton antiporter [Planctomycetia bacterium]|nr:cation:proton antiporter [Planctomycetia bacterium]
MGPSESTLPEPRRPSVLWTAVAYALMLAATVGGFFVVRYYGEKLTAPAAPPGEKAAPAVTTPAAGDAKKLRDVEILPRVLLALAAVVLLGQVLAKLFAFIGQPPVIGEVVAGILLGPSLCGATASAWILPQGVAPYLGIIAQVGVILYMFIVGLELNAELLRRRARSTLAMSQAGILLPFLLGAAVALYLYPRVSSRDVLFTNFALFIGAAMSVTAFPVLARILTDRKMTRTELGGAAMICAAMADVTAWCLLALVVGVARANVGEGLLVARERSPTSPSCSCSCGPSRRASPADGTASSFPAARWPSCSSRCCYRRWRPS